MRVLFMTLPARTHLYNMVPLAWSLHAAGHQVCVASAPDLTEETARTGLTPVPVGEVLNLDQKTQRLPRDPSSPAGNAWIDIGETRQEKLTWDFVLPILTYSSFIFQEVNTDPVIDDLVDFARAWQPDLVIWDPMTFAGPIAARASGAAHARMLWGMDLLARIRKIFLDFINHPLSEFWGDPVADWLGRTLKRFDCDFDEEIILGQWTIDPMPSWTRFSFLDLDYVPMRFVPFNGPVPIPRWAVEPPERPRVCLTLGLSKRELEGETASPVSALLDAAADLDIELIATLNAFQVESTSAVPENVRLVDFVPLSALLPSCSAIIHHGGSGTFGNALLQAVPQLIVPDDTWDTVLIGEHLARRGAGLCIAPNERSADDLRGHLERILYEPSFRRNADAIRDEAWATPGPADIVGQLEELTARHRPGRSS